MTILVNSWYSATWKNLRDLWHTNHLRDGLLPKSVSVDSPATPFNWKTGDEKLVWFSDGSPCSSPIANTDYYQIIVLFVCGPKRQGRKTVLPMEGILNYTSPYLLFL